MPRDPWVSSWNGLNLPNLILWVRRGTRLILLCPVVYYCHLRLGLHLLHHHLLLMMEQFLDLDKLPHPLTFVHSVGISHCLIFLAEEASYHYYYYYQSPSFHFLTYSLTIPTYVPSQVKHVLYHHRSVPYIVLLDVSLMNTLHTCSPAAAVSVCWRKGSVPWMDLT